MFSELKKGLEGLNEYIDGKERAFEDRCVREVFKLVSVESERRWGLGHAGSLPQVDDKGRRLSSLDDLWSPCIPVRFGSHNIVARRRAAKKRDTKDLAFFEMGAKVLFKPEEMAKTEIYRDWELLKEDGSLDRRPVGLLFPLINKVFVIHNANANSEDGICLSGLINGENFSIEPIERLIKSMVGDWCPRR